MTKEQSSGASKMLDTTREAVERLARAYDINAGEVLHSDTSHTADTADTLRALLAAKEAAEAESAALREGQGVTVKPLEWINKTKPDRWMEHYVAGVKGERRYFSITRQNSIGQTMYELESSFVPGRRRFTSIERAKDAAQDEHERRILSALTLTPVSVGEAARVLLDATDTVSDLDGIIAKAMDAAAHSGGDHIVWRFYQFRAAIRDLADKEDT